MANTRPTAPSTGSGFDHVTRDGNLGRCRSGRPGPIGTKVPDERYDIYSTSNDLDLRDILFRTQKMRDRAARTRMVPNAVFAMDHYLGGTGAFIEIHEWKTESVRTWFEKKHTDQAKKNFGLGGVMDSALSLAILSSKKGASANASKNLTFSLSWTGLGGGGGVNGKLINLYEGYRMFRTTLDDTLTYYGSTIKSQVRFRAKPSADNALRFTIEVDHWQSWVFDNYEFEDKVFEIASIDVGKLFGWPSQKELGMLELGGFAKRFPRSSRSWVVTDHGFSPSVFDLAHFTSDQIEAMADIRRGNEASQAERSRRIIESGGLIDPPPAEDMN